MAKNLHPPEKLLLTGNLKDNFRKFKQQFEIYITAAGISNSTENIKCATLLHVIGPDAIEIFNTFRWNEEGDNEGDDKKMSKVLSKFEKYCTPKCNVTYERHQFNTRNQKEGESIDSYVTELRILSKSCEFGDLSDSLIKDRIVCGVIMDTVRSRLLRETDLTLQKAVDICRAAEASSQQLKVLQTASAGASGSNIDFVRKKSDKNKLMKNTENRPAASQQKQKCGKCGYKHEPRKCPAFGKICMNCKKKNHFMRQCRSKKMHELQENDSDTDIFLDSVETDQNAGDWKVNVKICKKTVSMKLDTGAQCNVLPLHIYNQISDRPLKPSKSRLVSYSGHRLNTVGKVTLLVSTKNKYVPIEFEIVKDKSTPLFGLKACLELNLISRLFSLNCENTSSEEILENYRDVFEGLGCLPTEYRIRLEKDAKPIINPPRKIPYALRNKVKNELDRLEKMRVIQKVTEPTEWVNSLVVVEKPNKDVRLCLDPRELNKSILREHFPMKTVEEVAAKVKNAKIYSVLDASNGYWQIKITRDSQTYTTFNSPFGRYKYLRLPFGIKSSSEVFQRAVSQILENIEGCEVIADDILIWGKDKKEHNERLCAVLDRIKQANMKLNKSKCKIGLSEVAYVGHTFGTEGLKPSSEKIRAIMEIPEPRNKKELQRFMGTVNYLGKFISNLSGINQPLRQLLEKNVEWHWEDSQKKSFNELKKAITTAPVLQFYDENEDVLLSVDSSKDALGACILQNGHPVAYASRALNKSEQNYAQIEKEMAAIVFGATKFHEYIYAKGPIHVETDHRPLESIFKKPLAQMPPRIQRMMLKVQKYDLRVHYKSGRELWIADTLSRACVSQDESPICDSDYSIFSIENLPCSQRKLSELKEETLKDMELNILKDTVLRGWPENKKEINPRITHYWNFRDEISYFEGLMLKGEKVIIPKSMQKNVIEQIHQKSHLGINKCISRAKDVFYWQGMAAQIKDIVSQCAICNEFKSAQAKEPMIPHEIPSKPWEICATDLFELDKDTYIVLACYYSKFFEVKKIASSSSKSVINVLKENFSRWGIPKILKSDNGPAFASEQFKEFAENYGFEHVTSSPRYSQSMGFIEKYVQICKNVLKKAKKSNSDPYLAILEYRNTPIEGINLSPSQLLMGRRTRTQLPVNDSLLKPQYHDGANVQNALNERQHIQKYYYDRGAKSLPQLNPGDQIRVRNENKWEPGTVEQRADTPRSYVIQTEKGQKLRRNRRHLLKTSENRSEEPEIFYDCQENISSKNSSNFVEQPSSNISQSDSKKYTSSGRQVKMPMRFDDYVMK